MKNHLPLSTMLSQLLVAFTIEYDNEWEDRFWLTANPAPVRTSMVMWSNFLRFVVEEAITVRDLSRKAGYAKGKAHPSLAGMTRWRYVTLESAPKGTSSKWERFVQPTPIGLQAAEVWQPLTEEIETRWEARFGVDSIHQLKQTLTHIIAISGRPLPHYMPVLNHLDGMRLLIPANPDCDPPERLALPHLLAQTLQLFTLDAENNADLSLALRANVLRVLNTEGIPKRTLPELSGISKEAWSMSINYLRKRGYAQEEPLVKGRGKSVKLTPDGQREQHQYQPLLDTIETQWEQTYSVETMTQLRAALARFFDPETGTASPLFQGLTPPNSNLWRAKRPEPKTLPHHPMVLHRGGWPDGS